jgi:membrane associated rhomboid family serine protease
MFPISDDNPRRNVAPAVNSAIIAACVLAYLWQLSLGTQGGERAVLSLGMIPARLFGFGELPPDLVVVPAWTTVLTSMFLHGGLLHLAGNMLYLWIFGDNIEDSMGHGRYAVFYLLCGTAAALTQGFAAPHSEVPMVGASGAISGVLGAYILLHPGATVRVFIFLGLFFWIAHIPALIVLGVWFAMQLLSAATPAAGEAGVAFWAHIGGFVAGLALVPFFKRRAVPMLERPVSRPFHVERRRGPWAGPWG